MNDLMQMFNETMLFGVLVHKSKVLLVPDTLSGFQMCMMLEDASHLLDLLRAWIAPPNDANSASR